MPIPALRAYIKAGSYGSGLFVLPRKIMIGQTVSLNIEDGVAVLALRRPERRNAMNDEMAEAFAAAVDEAEKDRSAGALVVTGSGPAFCAGGDLEGFENWAQMAPAAVAESLQRFYGRFLKVMALSIPTIAAVNGPAVGAGACLAAACDLRLAADTAGIGFTFVRLGINPGMGAEYVLSRLVGPAKAFELLMTGEVLSAEEARRIGLVNRVVPADALLEAAVGLARQMAGLDRSICEVVKANIAAAEAPLEEILRREAENQAPIFTDAAFQRKIEKIRRELGGGDGD